MSSSFTPFAGSIVPDERLLAPLRVARRGPNSSGYRNVYLAGRNPDGNPVWKARVKRGRVLRDLPGSRSTQPHVVALHVARWYAEAFGPRWAEVLKARKVNPFQVRYSAPLGGFTAAVWVLGRREEVAELRRVRGDRWKSAGRLAVFASREQAKAGVRLYLRRVYGLYAPFVVYRDERVQRAKPGRAA